MYTHYHISAALFACFNHGSTQLFRFRVVQLHDAAFGHQRRKVGHAEFREFLDQEVATVSLGQGTGNVQREAKFAFGRLHTHDLQAYAFLGNVQNPGGILVAIAVEESDQIVGLETANRGEVVGFLPLEFDDIARLLPAADVRVEGVVKKEPIGHVINSGLFWNGFWVTLCGWKDAANIQEG